MDDILLLIERKNDPVLIEKITYAFLGVSGVLGWNAVLTSLQYFDDSFVDYDMSFSLPIPQLFANFFFGAMLPQLRKCMHIKVCIIGSMIGMIICLSIIPILTYFLNQTKAGFLALLGTSFALGMFNAILQGAVVSITNVVHEKLAAIYWTFNGFSGLLMNLFYAISLLAFPSSLQRGAIFYYSISVFFIAIAAYNFNRYYGKKYRNSDSGIFINNILDSESEFSDSSQASFAICLPLIKIIYEIALFDWVIEVEY